MVCGMNQGAPACGCVAWVIILDAAYKICNHEKKLLCTEMVILLAVTPAVADDKARLMDELIAPDER